VYGSLIFYLHLHLAYQCHQEPDIQTAMMGPQGWMPNHAPFGMNQHRKSLGSDGNGAPKHMMFEQRTFSASRLVRIAGVMVIPPISKTGVAVSLTHPVRGSFALNGAPMNTQCALAGPAHVTGSQHDVQITSEYRTIE